MLIKEVIAEGKSLFDLNQDYEKLKNDPRIKIPGSEQRKYFHRIENTFRKIKKQNNNLAKLSQKI